MDKVAKLIPMMPGKHITIGEAIDIIPELKTLYNSDPRIRELLDTAKVLEGMPRHASTHAAGVVISSEPLTEYVPLYCNEGLISTQFPMTTLEELGLLKMDFLALRTITVIRDTIDLIKKDKNIEIDIENIDYEDANVYEMIANETAGYSVGKPRDDKLYEELMPNCLEDIIAGISLYRPGPMDQL